MHTDTTQVDSEFFIHAVNSRLRVDIGLAHGGVGLRHITKGKLENIKVPVPPLEDQRCLVTKIRACMERIDEVVGLRAQSQAMATALLPAYLNDASRTVESPSVPLGEVLQDTQNGR